MSGQVESILDAIRQPEYTGENRCIPCTAVNVGIALVAGVVVAPLSIPVAGAVVILALGAIYLRGYLVPGTPELTKRYLPERVLRRFDHHPAAEEEPAASAADDEAFEFETVRRAKYYQQHKVNPEAYLLEAGVIEEVEAIDDIRLTDAFLDQVDDALDGRDIDAVDHADIGLLFDEEAAEVEDEGREYPAYTVGFRIRKWPSDISLLLDLAGEEAMRARTDDWPDVPLKQRVKMREMFRYLRETCPICDGPIVFTDDTVESCCGTWQVIAIKCDDCEHHFVELDPMQVAQPETPHGMTPD